MKTSSSLLSKTLANATNQPTTRVDRLLRNRILRNRSHQDFEDGLEDAAFDISAEGSLSERLIVIANRLPVTCSKSPADGQWQFTASSGGLVSALKGIHSYQPLWIGWPGMWIKPGRDRDHVTHMLVREGYFPVWIDPTLLDLYYNGFCNSVLWQLFHYVPPNIDSFQKMSEHRAMQMQWQAYQVANQKFADVYLANAQPHDIVWVQDYHLMLLPALLKLAAPKMKVGFFLHTPFPSSEIYRTLPVREEVLRAVLAADLVGFHTYDYARHFISCCTRILGLEGTPEGVENNGLLTRVGTFPIGIDPERFSSAMESEEVQGHVAKLLNRYAGRKIMLGVDRLDMVKGIPQKLLAYEKFLEENPEWRDKVLLVQIAVPSRTDVPEYQKLRSMVHEIVGRINGQFGTLTYVPIYHLDTSLSFTELCALYAVTDVCLVTSLRDGMNLVSYEFVACQSDNAGVLVLSEFAGAAQSLGAGALLVNPWNINDVAVAIHDSLAMTEEERRERHRQNYMHVQTHTAQHWADTFITELNDTHIEADLRMRHAPPPVVIKDMVDAYRATKRRLLVLGYNATLTTNIEAPRLPKRQFEQVKALAKVNPRVMQSVSELCQDPANVVLIFSGSETYKLDDIFGHLPVWLAAENGVLVRQPPLAGQQERPPWKCLFDQLHRDWMESVQLVFDYFCERTPRSFVEARETSLVWNYKYADVEFGRIQARDLLQHLWTGPISNAPVEIIQGGKSVEVRPVGVTKGLSMQRTIALMAEEGGGMGCVGFDMVLCIGHLLSRDENLFSVFEGKKIDASTTTTRMDRGLHNLNHVLLSQLSNASKESAAIPSSQLQDLLDPSRPLSHLTPAEAQSPRRALPLPTPSPLRHSRHARSSSVGTGSPTPSNTTQHPERFGALSHALAAASASTSSDQLAGSAGQPAPSHPPHMQSLPEGHEGRRRTGAGAGGAGQAAGSSTRDSSPSDSYTLRPAAAAGDSPELDSADTSMHGACSYVAANVAPNGLHRPPVRRASLQLHRRDTSGLDTNNPRQSTADKIASLFPPQHLYTVTVGRNRSKARYSLTASSEVADVLDALVNQGIYQREAGPPRPHLDLSNSMGMSGPLESFSSTEPLSPESMRHLINNWKAFQGSSRRTAVSENLAMAGQGSGVAAALAGAGDLQSEGSSVGPPPRFSIYENHTSSLALPSPLSTPAASRHYTSYGLAGAFPPDVIEGFQPVLRSPLGTNTPLPPPQALAQAQAQAQVPPFPSHGFPQASPFMPGAGVGQGVGQSSREGRRKSGQSSQGDAASGSGSEGEECGDPQELLSMLRRQALMNRMH